MPLYAYNKTAIARALPAGNPIKTLAAASSTGARGRAVDVTGELRPNTTVDPQNGVAGGLSAAQFALVETDRAAGLIGLEWTTLPEYNTATLRPDSAATNVTEEHQVIYVNSGLAGNSDSNPGTEAQPITTGIEACRRLMQGSYKSRTVRFDSDDIPRTYNISGPGFSNINEFFNSSSAGPDASPPAFVGAGTDLVAAQAEGVGGSTFLLNGTIPTTTVSIDPGVGGTTIDVGSTNLFPTDGIVLIGTEFVQYRGKNATQLLNCIRGAGSTTAAAHAAASTVLLWLGGYWVHVLTGVNAGSIQQIQQNTATTVTIARNFDAPMGAGDSWKVETAGTTIDINPLLRMPFANIVGFKRLNLNMRTDVFGFAFSISPNAGLAFQECNINLTGNFADFFAAWQGRLFTSSFEGIWSNDPNNPFSANDFAGLRVEGTGTGANFFDLMVGFADINTIYIFSADLTLFNGFQTRGRDFTNGPAGNTILNMEGGSAFVVQNSRLGIGGFPSHPSVLNRCPIFIDEQSYFTAANVDISDGPASGIVLANGASADLIDVISTIPSAGVGIRALSGECAVKVNSGVTLSGAGGDMRIGSRPVRSYADFRAAAPANSGTQFVEFDGPAVYRQPLKYAFTGLVAADSFDITTLTGSPPAAQVIGALRIVAGVAGHLGAYMVTDSGGTPLSTVAGTVVGVATLSDDGKTVTFPAGAAVTEFIIEYVPAVSAPTGSVLYQL